MSHIFSLIWNTVFFHPIYNLFLVAINLMPRGDVGFAMIALIVVVKLILFPLNQRAIDGQMRMKEIEPEIAKIKASGADKAEQSRLTYALYKEKGVNPFSSCLPMLIQFPVIIALYWAVRDFSAAKTIVPYSFVHMPEVFNLHFLGLVNLNEKSLVLAALAAITQYLSGYLMQARQGAKQPAGEDTAAQFAKTMQTQMLYVLPLITGVIAYQYFSVVALYLITSNIFTIGQELYTKRKMQKKASQAIV